MKSGVAMGPIALRTAFFRVLSVPSKKYNKNKINVNTKGVTSHGKVGPKLNRYFLIRYAEENHCTQFYSYVVTCASGTTPCLYNKGNNENRNVTLK